MLWDNVIFFTAKEKKEKRRFEFENAEAKITNTAGCLASVAQSKAQLTE